MKLDSKLNKFAQEGGFTLIEMLIVVAIIGILVAIAVPALNTAKVDAQDAKLRSAQSAVALAKNRAVLADVVTSSSTAVDLAVLSPYLLINGAAPTTWAQVMAGTGATLADTEAATALTALGIASNYSDLIE